ncbi:MAG: ArsR family transcriptional regulator [Acidobacteria bacterium]|jgi:DNA-binding IclR family transcriptional regulator|nr:ArsR family transcriptional regulator [Acidobacteriota bacterium]
MVIFSSPFGGGTRSRTLVALGLLGQSYPRELARLLAVPVSGVQAALRGLERDGLVAGRLIGRTRAYQLDPRYFALKELQPYLARLSEADPDLTTAVAALRRRPRRTGKPL